MPLKLEGRSHIPGLRNLGLSHVDASIDFPKEQVSDVAE
jgi:hypothetical protein